MRCRAPLAALLFLLGTLGAASPAQAAGPLLGDAWASSVASSSARLSAEVDPDGLATTYHFNYITEAAYEANLAAAKDGFTGASKAPVGADPSVGSLTPKTVTQSLGSLSPETAYRYRVVATSSAGTATGAVHAFRTQGLGGGGLPDARGWEMVSPVEKNGGQVDPPGALAGGGDLQAAADGESVTYGSATSFGAPAVGAPPASQYISRRGAGGWSTENVTAPLYSGSYDTDAGGVPYRLFSTELARGLLLNGDHCRGGDGDCAVANPPLAGSGAPAGYQNYYLRESAGGTFAAPLGAAELALTPLGPAQLDVRLAGTAPDLRHVVLSSCAALTPDAIEVPGPEGCDPNRPNLYEWSQGGGLSLLNLLPAQAQGEPGAALGAPSGAVSADGSRVYWQDEAGGNLYLREGAHTAQVDADAGGGGTFQVGTPDGAVAYYTRASHLWRYDAGVDQSADLTPAGGVVGVLGASEDGATAYYLSDSGLWRRHAGASEEIVPDPPGEDAADESDYPPATATARIGADGTSLAFVSSAPLTGYDNTDLLSGEADSEVYLYRDGASPALICVSCNPTGGRPIGPSTIPGALENGQGEGATLAYRPRALSADGRRLFFESRDALAQTDTNHDADVYQWEAQGRGSCAGTGGCLSLISSGRDAGGGAFVDASTSGDDVFFITDGSLVSADPGAFDLYDARVGGGFPVPPTPIPCEGDACQNLPPEPLDPTLTTLLPGPGNPKPRYSKPKHPGRNRHRHRHHRRAQRHAGRPGRRR